MTQATTMTQATGGIGAVFRLLRPKQWAKSAFVFVGPLYGLADKKGEAHALLHVSLLAAGAFALVSSACYIVNDVVDAERDRQHPRKRLRPIASGAVSAAAGLGIAAVLVGLGAVLVWLLRGVAGAGSAAWVAGLLGVYAANVVAYSLWIKRLVMLDVISLAMGFVLRVLAGCAAAGVTPSTWLLNCTLFLAMFLAFGKRLGERRTMAAAGVDVASVRSVQAAYSDDLLRMTVVVTGVATLVTYAGYVQSREGRVLEILRTAGWAADGGAGNVWFNLLWLTMLPAMYGLLRAVYLLEKGRYDDPTELVVKDRGTAAAAGVFVLITVGLMLLGQMH